MNSKFLTESTGEKIVKIGKYLAKIWPKYDSLFFGGQPCRLQINNLGLFISPINGGFVQLKCPGQSANMKYEEHT